MWVNPDPYFQELIDASVALSLREFLKSAANRPLNDYGRVFWLGHLHSPSLSRRSVYISALYLKSSEKNHKLEIDLPAMDKSQNSFRKQRIKIKEHSDAITQVYINFFADKTMIPGCGDRSTVNLEAFINFYIK